MLAFGRPVEGPFGHFFGRSQLKRLFLINIIDEFIAVFLTFWDFSVLSLRRRCIDVLTLIAGVANPLCAKDYFL